MVSESKEIKRIREVNFLWMYHRVVDLANSTYSGMVIFHRNFDMLVDCCCYAVAIKWSPNKRSKGFGKVKFHMNWCTTELSIQPIRLIVVWPFSTEISTCCSYKMVSKSETERIWKVNFQINGCTTEFSTNCGMAMTIFNWNFDTGISENELLHFRFVLFIFVSKKLSRHSNVKKVLSWKQQQPTRQCRHNPFCHFVCGALQFAGVTVSLPDNFTIQQKLGCL